MEAEYRIELVVAMSNLIIRLIKQWRMRYSFSEAIFLLLAVLPILAWIENALRRGGSLSWIDDYLLELVAISGPISTAVLMDPWLLTAFFSLMALVSLVIGLRNYFKTRSLDVALRAVFRFLFRTALVIWILMALSCWAYLSCWYTGLSAIAGIVLLGVYIAMRILNSRLRKKMLLICSSLGLTLFLLINTAWFYLAPQVSQRAIYTEAAYDVEELDGRYYITSHEEKQLVIVSQGDVHLVDSTIRPQRLDIHQASGTVYAANFCAMPHRSLSAINGYEDKTIQISNCRFAVYAAVDDPREQVLVVCEHSCSAHLYSIERSAVIQEWELPCLPDATAVDRQRARGYVTSEIISPTLSVLELTGEYKQSERFIGLISWDVIVDEQTGNVFISRAFQGEVVVFDENLNLLKRIRVGGGPRDMAIDEARRLLLVGNYFSGTLSLIDLDRLRAIGNLSVGDRRWSMRLVEFRIDVIKALFRRLRGVSVSTEGKWLIADATGVWEIEAEEALHSIDRARGD
ncbi:MAG: hypothetical protein P9M14_17080 [Candidatus Alcyoniella australis]|nr:hypothetical protein [Candidatus Alcyoniella australis]